MSEGMIRIYLTEDSIMINNSTSKKLMTIDRNYMSLSNAEVDLLNQSAIERVYKAHGIVGIIQIALSDFLIYVKNCERIGNIGNTDIYKILEVEFILITGGFEKSSELNYLHLSGEIIAILGGIKKIFCEGFYFSTNYDLTNSLQTQKTIKINNNNRYNVIYNADKNYLWNARLLTKFYDYNIDTDFIINLIYGFVSISLEKIKNESFTYILISRRNVNASGTFNHQRGLDEEGHSANTVETEQIVIIHHNVFSFVQVRATCPIPFFNTINKNNSEVLFNKHLQSLLKQSYKLVFMINLMNSFKEDEQALIEEFENMLKEIMPSHKNLKYSYFDIENESINLLDGNLSNNTNDYIDTFLNKLDSIFNIFKFFAIYFNSNGVKSIIDQIGLIRTNCLDCTDRTNTVQSRIAWKVFSMQLGLINIDVNNYMLLDLHDLGNLTLDENFKNTSFPAIWKENNDRLAYQYIGDTDSDEGFKQRVIDILLQRFSVKLASGIYN